MKRKLILTILIVVLSLIFLTGAKSSVMTKEEYKDEITIIEEEIKELENKIETIKAQIAKIEEEYSKLEAEYDEKFTKEDMYEWLNQCNIYNVRSNMKVEVKHYNTSFIGTITKSEIVSGSGFIFCSKGDTKYVLTTYDLIQSKGYKQISYTLYDAFQTKYTAKLYKSSKEYGLAILEFTDTYTNDLYVAPLSKEDPSVKDLVCNIYSLNNRTYNHMNFSVVESLDLGLFKNKVDTQNTISGCMSVDIYGNVIGIVSSITDNYCESISVSKIREYLLSTELTFN